MRFLKNLISSEALPGVPWDKVYTEIPEPVRRDKRLRDSWINAPTTEHCVYQTWEGLNENARITKGGQGREDNPPHKCWGFVGDFDTKMGQDEIAAGFIRMAPHLPNYYGVSLSGKCHLVWLFEEPINVCGFDLATDFLTKIRDLLNLEAMLPGLDKAFTNPARYYTTGSEWYAVSPQKLPKHLVMGWLVQCAIKRKYRDEGYNIPLPVVRAELLKNPKFAETWGEIDFQLGAQGPTWFVDGSESPKSALLKETGIFSYSSHASKNFFTWSELISTAFVDEYRTSHIGQAVDGIHFDGRQFWREITRGDWKPFGKEDILHYLRVSRGLSSRSTKDDQNSELDHAYEFLIDHHNIEGAAPFVFKPNGLIQVHEKPFLNVHTGRVLQPVPYKTEWGHPDHFPWLSEFFGPPGTVSTDDEYSRFFKGGHVALDTFISWLAHFYQSAHELNLASGHNLFICGPVGVGKTLLNTAIIGNLMNGYRDAKDYLMGEDDFGAELFSVAHWAIDDSTMSTSAASHRLWGEMIKRMAANRTFRFHEKFRTPQRVEWQGRVVSTLNNDEESTRLLPDMERSLLDKIGAFRTTDQATVSFPDSKNLESILDRELPYFARFLLEWKTPEHCLLRRGDGTIDYRFGGIKPWHDPVLMEHANQSSRTSGFYEILSDGMIEYFKICNKDIPLKDRMTEWKGSAIQLLKALRVDSGLAETLRGVDNTDVGRSLSQLRAKGYNFSYEDVGGIRYWTIPASAFGK